MRAIPTFLIGVLLTTGSFAQQHLPDQIYGHKMGVALTMDVFEPAKPNGIGVIWMVSGGWSSHYEDINPALAKIFTDRGMTVFEVVHGSQPKFQMTEILSDVKRAVRFIRFNAKKYHIDPNCLGVSGASSGGHLSLMIGATGDAGNPEAKDPVDRVSSEVEAVACFFPPVDLLNWGGEGIRPFKNPLMRVFWPAFGITAETPESTLEDMARQFSPIYSITAKMPPTFVMHGDKDPLVPLQQSELLMKKLDELKVPHELAIKKGGGHGWLDIGTDLPKFAAWFEKYLKPKG